MRIRTVHAAVNARDEEWHFEREESGHYVGEVPDDVGALLLSISRPEEYVDITPPAPAVTTTGGLGDALKDKIKVDQVEPEPITLKTGKVLRLVRVDDRWSLSRADGEGLTADELAELETLPDPNAPPSPDQTQDDDVKRRPRKK